MVRRERGHLSALVTWALISSVGALLGCRDHRGAAGEDLRDTSRLILERHCGACHLPDQPTARPGALAVFDLREADWSARMSDAQLRNALWRLGEPLPPDGSPNDATGEERAQFARFVDAEVAHRRGSRTPRLSR